MSREPVTPNPSVDRRFDGASTLTPNRPTLASAGGTGSYAGAVTVGGTSYPFARWSGERLLPADLYLAFDTETEVVDLTREVPRMALATVSAGPDVNVLIHPDDVGRFVLAHRNLRWVCFNAGFDFWVVEQHLRLRGEADAHAAWWELAAGDRLHDPMLLDMLVRLARDDTYPVPRDLAAVARETVGMEVSKDDPYRTRYGEIVGTDWSKVDPGFFAYAVKDAVVTRPAYLALRQQAAALADAFGTHSGDVRPDARQTFGLLSEGVQVKKAIALATVTRTGMAVDRTRLGWLEADLKERLDAAIDRVRAGCPELYKTDAEGRVLRTPAGAPRQCAAALDARLARVAAEVERDSGVRPSIPPTRKTRKPSCSRKVWQEYREYHPFLRAWLDAGELAKQVQYFAQFRGDRAHPRYSLFVRSGRSCASAPNVQQAPRDGPFRGAFVASPGYLLLAVDYKFVELVTLAAHLLHRYGKSALADVIRAGVDPHAHTAAVMLGVPPEEFLTWKTTGRRAEFAAARQAAKPINFGVPAGLGVASLQALARSDYGVELKAGEALARRELLIHTIYPELGKYLAEDATAILARNLHAPADEVAAEFGDVPLVCVERVLAGEAVKANGKPYQRPFVSQIWASLAGLNRNPELADALAKREPDRALAARVCHAGVATLTGRVRGRVGYTQARNTPFQGLAADGAGLALFDLVKEGFRVVGLVHDELLVELPADGGSVSAAAVERVQKVMCEAMARVLVGGVPVGCEAVLSDRWDKAAGLVVRGGRAYPAASGG